MEKNGRLKHPKRRRLRFLPLFYVLNLLPGEYQSIFKGEGEENFVDLKPYQTGDDAKRINWPYYARTRFLFVIERVVPKNLTIISAIDLSRSMYWSEQKLNAVDAFFEILIGSLVRSGSNSLGCIGFSAGIERYFPPRAGKTHFAQILKWYTDYAPQELTTNIPKALDFIARKIKPKSLVFFISDFFDNRDFEKELRAVVKNFDFIPVVIQDSREFNLPSGARIDYHDAETGKRETIWLTPKNIRGIETAERNRQERLTSLFRRYDLDPIFLDSSGEREVAAAIYNFFSRRVKRKRG